MEQPKPLSSEELAAYRKMAEITAGLSGESERTFRLISTIEARDREIAALTEEYTSIRTVARAGLTAEQNISIPETCEKIRFITQQRDSYGALIVRLGLAGLECAEANKQLWCEWCGFRQTICKLADELDGGKK